MAPETIALLQDSWRKVAPIADQAARLFYDRLFAIEPPLRALFRSTDFDSQRRKLVQALTTVITNLEKIEELVPTIEALGSRHAGYGVQERHYDAVGKALLWTLEQRLGNAWTDEVKTAWTEAYGLVAGVMKSAAVTSVKSAA